MSFNIDFIVEKKLLPCVCCYCCCFFNFEKSDSSVGKTNGSKLRTGTLGLDTWKSSLTSARGLGQWAAGWANLPVLDPSGTQTTSPDFTSTVSLEDKLILCEEKLKPVNQNRDPILHYKIRKGRPNTFLCYTHEWWYISKNLGYIPWFTVPMFLSNNEQPASRQKIETENSNIFQFSVVFRLFSYIEYVSRFRSGKIQHMIVKKLNLTTLPTPTGGLGVTIVPMGISLPCLPPITMDLLRVRQGA